MINEQHNNNPLTGVIPYPKQIIMVKLSDILTHPKETEIYGDVVVESEFVESVRSRGVLTPLTVTDSSRYGITLNDGKYICVSGHRRAEAAIINEFSHVPAIVRKYESDEECTLDFLFLNQQREKNNAQRINEFFEIKSLLKELGKLHRGKGLREFANYQDEEFLRALRNYKIEGDKPLDSVQILKAISGFTEWEQRLLTEVNDDTWKVKQYEKLRNINGPARGMTIEYEEVLDGFWNTVRQLLADGNCTLREARNEIKNLLDEAEKKFLKKVKKAPKEQPVKKVVVEEIEKPFWSELPALNETWSQSPMKFSPDTSIIDYCLKTKSGYDVGIVRTLHSPVGICVKIEGVSMLIDFDRLAEMIQGN